MAHHDSVLGHSAFAVARELRASLDGVDPSHVSGDESDRLVRSLWVLGAIADVADHVDPTVVSLHRLNDAALHLDGAKVHLVNYVTRPGTPDGLNDVSSAIDFLDRAYGAVDWLVELAHDGQPLGHGLQAATVGIVERMQTAANDAVAQAQVMVLESSAGIASVAERVSGELAAINAEAAVIRETLTADKERADAEIGRQQAEFNNAERARSKQFTDDIGKWTGNADAELAKLIVRANEAHGATQTTTSSLIHEIEGYRDNAKEMIGLIAVSALAKGYEDDAKADEKRSGRMRLGLYASLVAAIVVAFAAFKDADGATDFDLERYLGRSGISAILLALAGYLGRQSGVYRKRAEAARRLYRQLQAFGPYTEPLHHDIQQAVRTRMTERFFPADVPGDDHEDGADRVPTIAEIVALLRKDPAG
jgi:hypothetical protein